MNNNTSPLISVVIPVFNHSKYIVKCLDSIKKSGWAQLELVIIDDGSTDDSYNVTKEWLDENESFFEKITFKVQKNQGITKTLNRLIECCSGEFIVLLASDDYLLNESISTRYRYLLENKGMLAVFCDAIGVSNEGEEISPSVIENKFQGRLHALKDPKMIAKELILNWSVPGPVFMARAETFQILGKYDEQYFIEDRYFYLKLLSVGKLGFVAEPLAAYRIHDESMTGNRLKSLKIGLEVLKIERDMLTYFSGRNRFYLQIQIWSNYSAVFSVSWYLRPFYFVRCIFAKVLKKVIRL
ncbi:MAG: glycosyltransferase [Neisseriaceae bacterium]|nr:glycosyltransferase [Neisseriaceae bacterium]